jgi:uncharacterized protein (DUF885 family)
VDDLIAQRVARSNAYAEPVIALAIAHAPENASQSGLTQADAATLDLDAGWRDRVRAAAATARDSLALARVGEHDAWVLDDLTILERKVDEIVAKVAVEETHLVVLIDVAHIVFGGLRPLLDDQNPPARQRLALERLRRYAGLVDGVPALAISAERETRARLRIAGLTMPYVVDVETALAAAPLLLDGMREMFAGSGIDGWSDALETLRAQCERYATFLRDEVLPLARTDHRLPLPVYADALKRVGIDIPPADLARAAHAAFDAIVTEMQALAPRVAAELGIASNDYRDCIAALKQSQIHGDAEAIRQFYLARLADIEAIVQRERLVTLPHRPARIRVASLAESAALPVAHMNPPPLVGNTGQVGEFVLPLDVPPAAGGDGTERSDDFTHDAVTWTLTAHEARPGHEVQFDRMLEGGQSLARAVFAFNSVNVEGWALYAERLMFPFMPPAGQLCSLLMRLHRAARAFLDPELQSGERTPAEVQAFLEREVVFSPTFARSEVERYTFRAPGQATAYFYGYAKLVALRAEIEATLGGAFDARAFHDFILDAGLVPPDALGNALRSAFVPTALAAAAGST